MLPSYPRPPVQEVACGVQFSPPLDLGLPEVLALRERFKHDYPRLEEHPPIAPIVLGSTIEQALLKIHSTSRVWFISDGGQDLVQLQRDRFVFNWRKVDADDSYPRFDDHVWPRFESAIDALVGGLGELHRPVPSVDAFEVAYVNIVPLQSDQSFSDVLEPLRISSDGFLPDPTGVQMSVRYAIDGISDGELIVETRSAVHVEDSSAAVLINLTARGRVDGTLGEALRGLRTGREWIVRAFDELTTEGMHAEWGGGTDD